MKKITDQLNREIKLVSVPRRIVSLVPSQTELLVDLGLREQIVGVTKFCVHPEEIRKHKKIVGGTKQVHYNRIQELEPEIILCNKEENTQEMVEELQRIAPVHVSDVRDIESAVQLIEQYGEIFEVEERSAEIKETVLQEMDNFRSFIKDRSQRRVAYFIWKEPWMAAGKDNFINYLLKMNRFENIFENEDSRYPVIELVELESKEVELLLLSTEPYPFREEHKKDLQEKFKGVQVEIVDGEFFSWYGSRLIQAFKYFRQFHLSFLDS